MIVDDNYIIFKECFILVLKYWLKLFDLVYIIFIFGIIGKFKGVMIEYGGLSNWI